MDRPAPRLGLHLLYEPRCGTCAFRTRHERYLELLDVVGRHVEADADGDEDETDDEEGGEHGARGEDGLPGGQSLLLEGRVLGLLAAQSAATGPGHGDVSVLVFGVVARRHHGCCLPPTTKLSPLATRKQTGLNRRGHVTSIQRSCRAVMS